jgi:hypothetical protein
LIDFYIADFFLEVRIITAIFVLGAIHNLQNKRTRFLIYNYTILLTRCIFSLGVCLLVGCKENKQSVQQLNYHTNGKIKAIKELDKTVLNGPCFWFYPNGKLEKSLTYINGEVEGHAYYFYESGALKAREIIKNGKAVGYAEYFYDHSIGLPEAIRVFNDNGKLIYIKQFDTSGKIIREEGSY